MTAGHEQWIGTWKRGPATEDELEDRRDRGDFEAHENAEMNAYERQFGW